MFLFAPPAANSLTGGYLYNQFVADQLDAAASVRYRWVRRQHLPGLLRQLGAAAQPQAVVLDSLYFKTGPLAEPNWAARLPVVLLCHVLPWQFWPAAAGGKGLERYFAGIDAIVTTSNASAEELRRLLVEHRLALPVVACPPGVDAARFSPVPAASVGAGNATPEFLTVANVLAEKGHLFLLEALAEVRSAPWYWRIVGDRDAEPATTQRLLARVAELGLQARVGMVGRLQGAGLVAAYQQADVMVLATERESYGMALLEAQACGLPVLVSDLMGPAEALGTDGGAIFVPVGDRAAWRRELRSLLTDRSRRAGLRSQALAMRSGLPTWRATAEQLTRAVTRLSAGGS